MNKGLLILIVLFIFGACGTHPRSMIKAKEDFVLELKEPKTRGNIIGTALEGILFAATYLADQTAKSLTNTYHAQLSVNDYFNSSLGETKKTYNEIHFSKYASGMEERDKNRLQVLIQKEYENRSRVKGESISLNLSDIIRKEEDDILNMHGIISIISDPENPGISQLSLKELYILFSKTRVYSDADLNAKLSISIEGAWRNTSNEPMKKVLIEQAYDLQKLKYGVENLLESPIVSPWYYDIPLVTDIDGQNNFGVIEIKMQLTEYEGNKSKYINKLPSILNDNKSAIIKNGASTIKKLLD